MESHQPGPRWLRDEIGLRGLTIGTGASEERDFILMSAMKWGFNNSIYAQTFAQNKGMHPAEVVCYNLTYPDSAKRAGLEGKAYLALHIDTLGVVTSVSIVKSSGHGILDTAAVECAREMLFKPAMNHGRVVASDRVSAFKFKKDESKK